MTTHGLVEVSTPNGARTFSTQMLGGLAPHPKGCVVMLTTGQKLLATEHYQKVQWLCERARRQPGVARYTHSVHAAEYRAWRGLRDQSQPWQDEPQTPLRLEDLDELLARAGDVRTHILDWLHAHGVAFAPVRPVEHAAATPTLDEHLLRRHHSVNDVVERSGFPEGSQDPPEWEPGATFSYGWDECGEALPATNGRR